MIASVPSATLLGVEGRAVDVEVHVSNGLPGFTIVGQPDGACREARDRVRASLLSSGLPWPQRRVTVNLAPSGLRKVGAGLDLAIAVGLLLASGELPAGCADGLAFVGELGLDGSVRTVAGVVPMVATMDSKAVVVAAGAVAEAGLVRRLEVRGVPSLRALFDALAGDGPWPEDEVGDTTEAPCAFEMPDLADVQGQRVGRWALEVAAAGAHHLLLTGPPGAGKTMLACRLPGLLPRLDTEAALETTSIHSAAGMPLPVGALIDRPPFRAPHHSASNISLVGGGTSAMRPGEISLAHNGVLFLDELGEFPANALDMLRQPLEEGVIRVSRSRFAISFPARFLLVAAMNPCPCGEGGPPGGCRCSPASRARYTRRLSGPLLDRFDLRVPVARPDVAELLAPRATVAHEPTAVVAARVAHARSLAAERGAVSNAAIPANRLEELSPLTAAATRVLEHELRAGRLSARGLHRVRRVARTVADLDGAPDEVDEEHVCAALELRVEPAALELAS